MTQAATPAPAPFASQVQTPSVLAGHIKGPRVFLDYDQAELDAAYDQRAYAPNQPQVTERWAINSDDARAQLGQPRRLRYGPSDIEELDLYPAARPNAPIHILIHGGAWRAGLARNYAFPAELFVRAGAHYLVPDFNNVIETGGDLMPMYEQVRRCVAWCYRNAASFGGDAQRIYVSGHSSGAHLTGVLAATDWTKEGLPVDIVKGYVCVSGMYELAPVRLSARSSYVKFTDETVQALSSIRHLDKIVAPMIVAWGSFETPEFQRQAREFAEALQRAGKSVRPMFLPGYNHFETIETLANPCSPLGRAALEQMGLAFLPSA